MLKNTQICSANICGCLYLWLFIFVCMFGGNGQYAACFTTFIGMFENGDV